MLRNGAVNILDFQMMNASKTAIVLFEDESELLDSCELISHISIGPDTKSHYLFTKVGG
jgi:hypothetical protein